MAFRFFLLPFLPTFLSIKHFRVSLYVWLRLCRSWSPSGKTHIGKASLLFNCFFLVKISLQTLGTGKIILTCVSDCVHVTLWVTGTFSYSKCTYWQKTNLAKLSTHKKHIKITDDSSRECVASGVCFDRLTVQTFSDNIRTYTVFSSNELHWYEFVDVRHV